MTPQFEITVDGDDITPLIATRLVRLSVIDEIGVKADRAEIEIDDRDHLIAIPSDGAKLEVALGFLGGGLTPMGQYVVDSRSGEFMPATMRIEAKAADMVGSIRAPKTRAWEDETIKGLLGRIASEHSLKPAIAKELAPIPLPYIAQTAESDLNLITRLGRDFDAIIKPTHGRLLALPVNAEKTVEGDDIPTSVLRLSNISQGSWRFGPRKKHGKVTAEYAALGEGKVKTVSVGDKKPELKLRHRYADKAEATRAATTAIKRGERAEKTLSLSLAGFHGDLIAGSRVMLFGVKPELIGLWLITRVEHALTGSLTTQIELEASI